jgi:hypothetical protein
MSRTLNRSYELDAEATAIEALLECGASDAESEGYAPDVMDAVLTDLNESYMSAAKRILEDGRIKWGAA